MAIRKAVINDFEIVKNITQTTIKSVYPKYYPEGAVNYFLTHHCDNNIRKDIENGYVYLISDIGTVTIKENHINRLFVLPEFQKKGYGKQLMDFAERIISEEYKEIVTDASLPAKSLYLKRGYIEIKYNKIETENGDYLCYDEMKKIVE